MNPFLDELFADLEPEYDLEPQDLEDEEEPEDQAVQDFEQEGISHEAWIAGVIARHYHRKGVIGDPDSFMPIAWEMEMGPKFAEAQAQANGEAEGPIRRPLMLLLMLVMSDLPKVVAPKLGPETSGPVTWEVRILPSLLETILVEISEAILEDSDEEKTS